MAHAHATYIPTRLGTAPASARRRSQIVKRRRAFLLVASAFLLLLGVLANYGPLHSYFDARARLAKADAGVAELTAQKEELQAEMGRLSQADYLESLARQDLSYARPGEELYIVTGADNSSTLTTIVGSSTGGANGSAGFMERVLTSILDGT